MKKLTIIALALCLAVVMAAPVMAVDADFSGAYRVRGSYVEHYDLKDTSPSHDFMDMRFRLQTVFKATDNLSVTTRFDALDNKRWGDDDDTTTAAGNIDFDRAYMTIKSGFGTFDIGRMAAGTFGTTFVDNESDVDRIKFTKVIDNLTLMAIYQKNEENDYDSTTTANEGDSETYYLAPIYKMENVTAGALFGFTNDKRSPTATTRKYLADPYFVAKFGPLAIQGELYYKWGETDNDSTVDTDVKALAYNVEASYNLGPASVMAGYAFISGDNDATDNEDSAYGNVGGDWEKLFILTTTEVTDLSTNLGNSTGNLSKTSNIGAKVIYGGANFSPLENLNLGLVVGYAEADKVQSGKTKDEYGTEYDLTLNWKIYDNLTYTAIAAYLDAGDLYEEYAGAANFENTYALFHQLQLSF